MKIKTVNVTAAFGLFSTTAVAGKWLDKSTGHGFDDYCKAGGSMVNTLHACVTVNPRFFFKITTTQSFSGYLGPRIKDKKGDTQGDKQCELTKASALLPPPT